MLIICIIYLLLSNSFSNKHMAKYNNRSLIIILLSCIIIATLGLNVGLDKGVGILGGLFNLTVISNFLHLFIFYICIIIVLLTSINPIIIYSYTGKVFEITTKNENWMWCNKDETKKHNKIYEHLKISEYPLILAFIITGAVFLISSADLVSLFISIELQSYGLYLLSSIHRNSEASTSAGLMYFLLGGLSSCFILLGSSLLYINTGTTSLEYTYVFYNISEISTNNLNNTINYALLILSVGLLFKISAAPFHFWSIDVYDAIPTVVTTFVAIIPKISIFMFIFELINNTICDSYNSYDIKWIVVLLISSLLSLIIGTVLGLKQSKIKKLFAYSTVSHVGFILLSLSINNVESTQAFLFYLIQYSVSNLNLFMILLAIGFISICIYNYQNKEMYNSPIQTISQIKGFFIINPILSISFAITIFSLIGIPPLIGFFGKQMVLSAALNNNYTFIVIIAILTSVISAVYYLNIIKLMFFEKPELTKGAKEQENISVEIDNNWYDWQDKDFGYNMLYLADYYKSSEDAKYRSVKSNSLFYKLSPFLSITISILTLIIVLFVFSPEQILSIVNILAIIVNS